MNSKLRKQITDAAGNVFYTQIAHWIIVNRLKKWNTVLKVSQIVLTAATTAGLIATISSGVSWLSWLSGFCSAAALFLNLYSLHFKLPDQIKEHTAAANELWDVREGYKSLLVDFADLPVEEIRKKRDELIDKVSQINKKYPGTDNKSFKKAQKIKQDYIFDEGEAEGLF